MNPTSTWKIAVDLDASPQMSATGVSWNPPQVCLFTKVPGPNFLSDGRISRKTRRRKTRRKSPNLLRPMLFQLSHGGCFGLWRFIFSWCWKGFISNNFLKLHGSTWFDCALSPKMLLFFQSFWSPQSQRNVPLVDRKLKHLGDGNINSLHSKLAFFLVPRKGHRCFFKASQGTCSRYDTVCRKTKRVSLAASSSNLEEPPKKEAPKEVGLKTHLDDA